MLSGCSIWKQRHSLYAMGTLLGAFFGSGCGCNGEVEPGSNVAATIEVSISTPQDGDTVTSQEDVSAADGIQVNVVVNVGEGGSGEPFFLSNSVDIDSSGAPSLVRAVADGTQVVFSGYTLPEGEAVTLRVVSEGYNDNDCEADSGCDEVTIRVVESFCEFSTPTNDATLNTDQYPGEPSDVSDPFEIDVVVDCFGIEDTDNVTLRVNGGRAIVAQPEPGNLVVNRVTFSRVVLAEGANILTAVPKTDPDGSNPEGAESSITVTVDTGRCNVSLLPSDGARILADSDVDLDPINGMQAVLDVVSDCAETSTVQLFIRGPGDSMLTDSGLTPSSTQDDPNGTRFRFDAVTLPESVAPFDVEVVAVVTDSGQEGASVPSLYWVDSQVPLLTQVSPTETACFGPFSDTDPATDGIQISAFGSVDGGSDGSEVWVSVNSDSAPATECTMDSECSDGLLCRDALCRFVATQDAGVFVADGVTLPSGDVTLTFIAQDAAGNRSLATESTIVVFESDPELTLSVP
ncbi:MAG: hypothetical protein AAFQ82_00975, partial [Myxococcota bacterium]